MQSASSSTLRTPQRLSLSKSSECNGVSSGVPVHLFKKWRKALKWLTHSDGECGCKFCPGYVKSDPKLCHLLKHESGRQHQSNVLRARGEAVDLPSPTAEAFPEVWTERFKGTPYRKSKYGRTQSYKMVFCLNEAIMDDFRKSMVPGMVSGCLSQDDQANNSVSVQKVVIVRLMHALIFLSGKLRSSSFLLGLREGENAGSIKLHQSTMAIVKAAFVKRKNPPLGCVGCKKNYLLAKQFSTFKDKVDPCLNMHN